MSDSARQVPQGKAGNAVLRGQKVKLDKGTLKKLLKRVIIPHKFAWLVVLILIIISSYCDVQSSLFIGRVIDDKITPVIDKYARKSVDNPIEDKKYTSYDGITDTVVVVSQEDLNALDKNLWDYIKEIIVIFSIAIIATFAHQRLMIYISQGVQKEIRDEMFAKMQELPVRYFDTNSHGDIMSRYTNDIETLNQMISESIPQTIGTFVTIVAVVVSMFRINSWLTIFAMLLVFILITSTKKIMLTR